MSVSILFLWVHVTGGQDIPMLVGAYSSPTSCERAAHFYQANMQDSGTFQCVQRIVEDR